MQWVNARPTIHLTSCHLVVKCILDAKRCFDWLRQLLSEPNLPIITVLHMQSSLKFPKQSLYVAIVVIIVAGDTIQSDDIHHTCHIRTWRTMIAVNES